MENTIKALNVNKFKNKTQNTKEKKVAIICKLNAQLCRGIQ